MFHLLKYKILILSRDQACNKMGQMQKHQTIKVAFKQLTQIIMDPEVFLDRMEGTQELHKKLQSKKILARVLLKFIKIKMFQMQFNYKKHSKKL